jgi:septum formation topological specificity factor MinE
MNVFGVQRLLQQKLLCMLVCDQMGNFLAKSAKGAAARRQTVRISRRNSGGALDTVPVLREFLKSAKGAAARRQTVRISRRDSGGALDTVPVLREFLKSAKGAAARRQTVRNSRRDSGRALDTVPVLRVSPEIQTG